MDFTLRDYQLQAEHDIRQCYRSGKRAVCLVMPTGAGKTRTFCSTASQSVSRGKRVLILVHRKELLLQTSRTLESVGLSHGLIAPGITFNHRAPIQVASVQTLVRRLDVINWSPDFIIVDEAHHATRKTIWGQILNHFNHAYMLGVTATPQRLDGHGLGVNSGGFFDSMVTGPSVRELTRRGFLSPSVVYAPKDRIDLSGVSIQGGDYKKNALADVMANPAIVGNAVDHYRKYCHQQPAIAFCASVSRAEEAAVAFKSAGYSAACVSGQTDDKIRAKLIADLGNGQLNVLTSCNIVSEGTDIPVVSAAILLRPTQSLALALQQMGRVLRPHKDKTHATILDHAGNVFVHGFPDDDREWSLDAKPSRGKKTNNALPMKQCDRCFTVHRPAPICPQCGYVYPIASREITELNGELSIVTSAQIIELKPESKRAEQANQRTLNDLIELAKRRGYKHPRAWAQHIFDSRTIKQQKSFGVNK
ncbi:DEAD/DEAH box helicase family protein [Rhodoferax sp. 4810]|uniref:DEAD/DEAH box helicase family protein n=1 Tax=Thiospirillum jenense TaxID=1653858 RepID=A0A839H782_9GAMM|nr:DEAD/DEAH box helicase [Thiospirillum jenense]MBB1074493.1 DEAD/DEAH box helicase family protein [Rhodoferax jenense]MBB1125523.1 DEAD/DEAH box helicase family protein [Thiospirillum jenense]